jgi:hypothetical protein
MADRPRQCPEWLRKAFIDDPTYVELMPGEHLYKFVSIPIVRARILESPWWIRQQTFDDLQIRARRLQKPLPELVRSQMAIAQQWNPGMDTLYVIVLAASADGWEGRARWQPVSLGDSTVMFTGGGQQLAVPGLTWQQIGVQYSGWPPASP